MPLGIDPKVDFAFKLMLGNPRHPAVTIHFLNAVLNPAVPVVEVEILNPFQIQDRSTDKLSVLDVLARDAAGRLFNVEMQTTLPPGLPRRLTYYNCRNYVAQLKAGEGYGQLRPAINICVLDKILFPQIPAYHLSFRLRCDQTELVFCDDLQFHTLELPKFHATEHNIGKLPPLERWMFLLRNAERMEPQELANLLVDDAYQEAIGVLKMISHSPDEQLAYEARLQFMRDEEAKLIAARQEGFDEGAANLIAARQEGIDEGIEKGHWFGRIQTLQELLGETPLSNEALGTKSTAELQTLVSSLQARFRNSEN
jgi:predicted transposase/invertase (TIGR01784 family)